ncbi:MAG: response regulator [Planctomycetaceae bacterium]|nr:response regulator [Planctomycetaceae bacterium]
MPSATHHLAAPSPAIGSQPRLADLATGRSLRLLHVDDDSDLVLLVDRLLSARLPRGSVIDPVANLSHALSRLTTGRYDAILLELSLPDSDGLSTVEAVRSHEADTPIVVLTGREDAELAGNAIRSGATDVLFKSRLSAPLLDATLCSALLDGRRSRGGAETVKDRRESPHYTVTRPSIVIPMLADFRPDTGLVATTIDISLTGAGLLVEGCAELTWDRLVLGIERADGVYTYATAMVRHHGVPAAGWNLGVSFVAAKDDPLSAARLAPRFDPETCQMTAGLPEPVLVEWAQLGVLQPRLIDRVRSCPRCSGLPTFRDACRQCGSVKAEAVQYIHHFACAHVAPADHFDGAGHLACPKCRARNLIVGADFEYLSGPICCRDCNWSGTQLASVGECLKCGHRFVGSEATERDIIHFHVERLDPLAFIEAD